MRILVAPDKFKGSLDATQAAAQMMAGLRDVLPNAEIVILPVADGGEGTAAVICGAAGGAWQTCSAHDAIGRTIEAHYCTLPSSGAAVMEMSEASGLGRLRPEERDPLVATSFGTGEMLLHAARCDAAEIIIGLGGSATNDGGFGLARALGYRFLAANGSQIGASVPDLLQLARIERPRETLSLPPIIAAADVRIPLLGPRGATHLFGPQKGATPAQVELLERALGRLTEVVVQDLGCDHRETPGSGAAGGLGFGLLSFCAAQVRSGFEVVAERVDLVAAIATADVVITGEGRLDRQTLEGKAPAGVARLARAASKRVFAIVGTKVGADEVCGLFDGIYELVRSSMTCDEAVRRAADLVRERAGELARERLLEFGHGDMPAHD